MKTVHRCVAVVLFAIALVAEALLELIEEDRA